MMIKGLRVIFSCHQIIFLMFFFLLEKMKQTLAARWEHEQGLPAGLFGFLAGQGSAPGPFWGDLELLEV